MSRYKVDIDRELTAIQTTPYGKTMRPNLHDALKKLADLQGLLSDSFEQLIINAGSSNAEVVDARNDATSTPHVVYPTLGDRLDAIQQTLNDHQAIPHITYRVIGHRQVIATDKDEIIMTDKEEAIEVVEPSHKKENQEGRAALMTIDTVKVTDLPMAQTKASDLLIVETERGTSSTTVEELLDKVGMKYKEI